METTFFSELIRELLDTWQLVRFTLHKTRVGLRNWLRRVRHLELDYVVVNLSGTFPERSGPPRSFLQRQLPLPPEPLSIELLNRRLEAVCDADNVKGVVFILQGLSIGLATNLSIRNAIQRVPKQIHFQTFEDERYVPLFTTG